MNTFCPYCGSTSHGSDYHESRGTPRAQEPRPSRPTTESPLRRSEREPDPVRGTLLRALREARNITLREGANAIGCSIVELSDIERSRIEIDDASWQRVLEAITKPTQVLFLDTDEQDHERSG